MRARDVEAVRLLLEFGADPNKTPPTPPSTGRADDAFLPRTTTPLFTAIAGGDGAKFGVGANITKEAEQPKVYRFPSERNLARVASLVIAAGAAVNATDEQGATALHLAARAGDDDLVKVLVSHGANLRATDKEGLTALDYAEGKVGSSRARRGRAGAPQVHESTAQLLRQLLDFRHTAVVVRMGNREDGMTRKWIVPAAVSLCVMAGATIVAKPRAVAVDSSHAAERSVATVAVAAAHQDAAAVRSRATVQPGTAEARALLDKYCVTCHNQRVRIPAGQPLYLDKADVKDLGQTSSCGKRLSAACRLARCLHRGLRGRTTRASIPSRGG